MAQQGELRIPVALRPTAEQIITLTAQVCADLLDEEYAALARHVVAKLARRRPSPLLGGRAATWAGGQGVIPYVPDLGRDGTAAAEAALRS